MRIHSDGAAVDLAVAGDHAVAVGRVFIARRAAEGTDLHEGTFVQQRGYALARGGEACFVALGLGLLGAGVLGLFEAGVQVRELLRRRAVHSTARSILGVGALWLRRVSHK